MGKTMSKIEELNFIEELGEKTTTGKGSCEFTNYKIHKSDFKKILGIIKSHDLLVLPKESAGGSIEGYDVLSLQGKLILRFGEKNLPPKECGFTLEKLFTQLVRDKDNLFIYEILKEDKIIQMELPESFTEVKCCQ
ncbi:hypothetical protein KKG31_02585 [Patescibacteria group bacterium]|nr:hypothetical protein [Patescibacteria group bacterium]MBU1758051.1 hypothetical protein [Patescibacteria group bacterium]